MNRKQNLISILLIGVFSVALYANTIKNGFVYDDETTIVNNTFIKRIGNFPKLFQHEYFSLSGEATYRPVVTFTYFIDYTLYDLEPWGYHLTNILLHAANGALLYIFLTIIVRPVPPSSQRSIEQHLFTDQPLLISLLFVSHPVLTEAVNAISFREDLLAFLFYLASLILYLILRKNITTLYHPPLSFYLLLTASCLLYIFSLLSKEMAVTLPLVISCYESVYTDKKKEGLRTILVNQINTAYIAVTIAYIYLRFYYFYNPVEGNLRSWNITERVLTLPWLLLNYLKLAIFPISLSADHTIAPIQSLSSIYLIISISAIILLIYIAIGIKKVRREIAFGILFFLITLFPVYNIIPIAYPFAERYLYLPIIGFTLFLGITILQFNKDSKHGDRSVYLLFLLSVIVCMYAFNVIYRNKVWKSEYLLWSDTLKKMPNSPRAHTGVGFAFFEQGRIGNAIKEYETAIRLKPISPDAYNNLGNLYAYQGRYEEAAPLFRTVFKLKPDHPEAHNNLGMIYTYQGQFNEAIKQFRIALSITPDNPTIHTNLGFSYYKRGEIEKALQQYHISLTLNPNDPDTHNNVGMAYSDQGRLNEAIEEFRIALRYNPYHSEAYYHLGLIYNKQERLDEAIQNLQTALRLNPNSTEAHYNLGLFFLKKGLAEKAKMEFELSVKLKPDFLQAHQAIKALNK